MFRCVECGMTFRTLRELLVHFFVERERECWSSAMMECIMRGAGMDTVVMIMDAGLGEVDKWLPRT